MMAITGPILCRSVSARVSPVTVNLALEDQNGEVNVRKAQGPHTILKPLFCPMRKYLGSRVQNAQRRASWIWRAGVLVVVIRPVDPTTPPELVKSLSSEGASKLG